MAGVSSGTVIANYRIEGEIGSGGMGVVYKATQRTHTFERHVALKLIRPEFADDVEFRRRFISESRNAAPLGHPNVLPVIEADEEDGQLFIAMQDVQDEDLDAVIARRGPLPGATAVRLLSEVAGALDAAHAQGLVHRDVKPPNILVSGRERHEEVYLTYLG